MDWLSSQPSVDPERIGIVGASRGAELALLLGSIMPRIHAVVAYMPSSVVISGCCSGRGEPAWTIGGKPVAYVPPRLQGDFALRARAAIRVEQIHGGVLLISGTEDEVWPSDRMSAEIMDRLQRSHFAYPFKHLSYEHAGHGIGRPYTSTTDVNSVRHPLTGRLMRLGGTPSGTAHARSDSWPQVLAFLDESLRSHFVSSAATFSCFAFFATSSGVEPSSAREVISAP
jgi:dienelactone hydrolase